MKINNIQLLAIDCQNDFMDQCGSAMPVPGAVEDMKRLARMIDRLSFQIKGICVTLDNHNFVDIAHPIFWVDAEGNHPSPFKTIISLKDLENGKWRTFNPYWQDRAYKYVKSLNDNGHNKLIIWEPHCFAGMYGSCIVSCVSDALLKWCCDNNAEINFIYKGMNKFTEHYSALRADVPDPLDITTQTNIKLLDTLREADEVIVAGEALSHCVRNSVLDIIAELGDEHAKKFILLEDCCSSVKGFEYLGKEFIEIGKSKGMQVMNSQDYSKGKI